MPGKSCKIENDRVQPKEAVGKNRLPSFLSNIPTNKVGLWRQHEEFTSVKKSAGVY